MEFQITGGSMPLYEYVCSSCDVKFERLRTMAEGGHADCPDCGIDSRRVLSVFAAFSQGGARNMTAINGGGCACASGGTCGCAAGF